MSAPVSTSRASRRSTLRRFPYAAALFGLLVLQYILKAGPTYFLTGAWPIAEALTPATEEELMEAFRRASGSGLFRALVTLLFLWAGTLLTLRRARDAGASAGFALLVLVPALRYVILLAFCSLPSGPPSSRRAEQGVASILSGALGAPSLMLAAAVCLRGFGHEAGPHLVVLGVGALFLAGLSTAWLHARRGGNSLPDAVGSGLLASLLCWSLFLLLGLRLAYVLVTFLPVVLLIALPGALLGGALARATSAPRAHSGQGYARAR